MPSGTTAGTVIAIRTYSELRRLQTFEERFRYLQLSGDVGEVTFGFDRYLNQRFYKSQEWKAVRDRVIIRDNACDLGANGYDIHGKILIHHMNPISPQDIEHPGKELLDPEYLIATTHNTHNAIHYGDEGLLVKAPVERFKNDTCPWLK
jgi:hypothetical protein